MNKNKKADLIDRYFQALDEDDFTRVEPVLADEVRFKSSADELSDADRLRAYMEEGRMISNSTHEINRRIHDDDVSVVEGMVRGETADGPVQGAFCDVFEFDQHAGTITSITVYTRL